MKCLAVLFLLAALVTANAAGSCDEDGKVIVCYYGSWSFYRTGKGRFAVEDIDPTLCTHIVYTFAGLDINFLLSPLDYYLDIESGNYAYLNSLKNDNPCLKTTLAVGGWNEGSLKYSAMAESPQFRENFASSVLRYLMFYNFDGIDLDWEYPTERGGIPEDKNNFAMLLDVLYSKLVKWDRYISIAVPISAEVSGKAYDMVAIEKYVKYIHIMAYDYTTSNSATTGLTAPVSEITKTIELWKSRGISPNKLVLGMPSYANTFKLKDPSINGIGAPSLGPGPPGDITLTDGFLAYYELLPRLATNKYVEHKVDGTYYAYHPNGDWITYDKIDTYEEKTQLALDEGLGGVMLWSIDTDDFRGSYGEPHTILQVFNRILRGNSN